MLSKRLQAAALWLSTMVAQIAGRRIIVRHQARGPMRYAALDGEMHQLGDRGRTRDSDAHRQMNPPARELARPEP